LIGSDPTNCGGGYNTILQTWLINQTQLYKPDL
jgi:hypothetical protein